MWNGSCKESFHVLRSGCKWLLHRLSVVDDHVIVSEDTVTLRIWAAQLAHQHYRNEKLHDIFYNVAACIFRGYANERDYRPVARKIFQPRLYFKTYARIELAVYHAGSKIVV